MADNRKEQERAELHKMIWNAATDLVHAGGVDAWDFKQYVLGTMFIATFRKTSPNTSTRGNERRAMLISIMPICPMKKQSKPVMILSKRRVFLFCHPSCSATSARGRRRMRLSMKRSSASFTTLKIPRRGARARMPLRGCSTISTLIPTS